MASTDRDDKILDALALAVQQTGEFDAVIPGADPKTEPKPAQASQCCWIARGQWWEDDRFGADDAIRTVEATIYLATVNADPGQRLRTLARLESLVIDRLQNTSLGGMTFPGLTKFHRGRDEKALPPVGMCSVRCQFAYAPDDGSGRDEETR
jgi:hypothetical protein